MIQHLEAVRSEVARPHQAPPPATGAEVITAIVVAYAALAARRALRQPAPAANRPAPNRNCVNWN